MSFRTDRQYMTEPANGWNDQWGAIFGGSGNTGEARLTDYYKTYCPFYMFNEQSVSTDSNVKYFFDCGDDEEQLLVANDDLHVLLRNTGMSHEFRVRNGGHESSYWTSAMTEVLPFIQACFKPETYKLEEQASLPGSHTAVAEEKIFASAPATVYLPPAYALSGDKSYPVLYYLHNGDEKLPPESVMKMLSDTQVQKPFILIACNASQMVAAGTSFGSFMAAAENDYRVLNGNTYRLALGYGLGGKLLYEASLNEPLFASLFLVDGALEETIAQPNSKLFYYITIADMGAGYKGANTLYKYCHSLHIPFEYRVYNGTTSSGSAIYGLSGMKSAIYEKIKIQ
jgi:hypothetical protein